MTQCLWQWEHTKGTRLPIEGSGLPQVYVNTDFLKQARLGTPLPLSGRVMVLGGGNVAYDCARTALRLGAEEVHIACLENEQQMTSTPEGNRGRHRRRHPSPCSPFLSAYYGDRPGGGRGTSEGKPVLF